MTRIVLFALAAGIAVMGVYLAVTGRKNEEPGAAGASWTLLALALVLAAYAFVDLRRGG